MSKGKLTGRQKCFIKRDKWIVRLGFGTYQNYLQSALWKRIRIKVLEKRRHLCFYCGKKATEIHHLRYTKTVLMAEGDYWMGGLVALCRSCHQKLTDIARDEKIHEATAYSQVNRQHRRNISRI